MPLHLMGFSGPKGLPAHADQAKCPTTVGTAITDTVGAAVATTGATQTSPFGYTTAAQADALVSRVNQLRDDVLTLTTLLNACRTDVLACILLANQLRADLVDLGLLKGSA